MAGPPEIAVSEPTLLTTEELAQRIKYDPRTVRERLLKRFKEGKHYVRLFGGRKILYNWEAIRDELGFPPNAGELEGDAAKVDRAAGGGAPQTSVRGASGQKIADAAKTLDRGWEPIQPFTLPQARLLIEAVRPDYTDYVLVQLFSGMKSAEAKALTWRSVDFEARTIKVIGAQMSAGAPSTPVHCGGRVIWMNRPVVMAMQRLQARNARHGDHVFCGPNGASLVPAHFTREVWEPLLHDLGLEVRHPDNMRHTYALLLLAAGERPDWIASQLGEYTAETVQQQYSPYLKAYARPDGRAVDLWLQDELLGSTGNRLV